MIVNTAYSAVLPSKSFSRGQSVRNDSQRIPLGKAQNSDSVSFSGNREEIGRIFAKMAKEVPAEKLKHVEHLQSIFEKLPPVDKVKDLASFAYSVATGDVEQGGITTIGMALDHTFLAPIKIAFVSAAGAKGAAVGTLAGGPLGTFVGGIAAGFGAGCAWSTVRDTIVRAFVNLASDS